MYVYFSHCCLPMKYSPCSYHMLILKTQDILFPYHLKLYLYMVISFLHMILTSSKHELLLPISPNGTKIPEDLFFITNSKLHTISLGQFSLNRRIPKGCFCVVHFLYLLTHPWIHAASATIISNCSCH